MIKKLLLILPTTFFLLLALTLVPKIFAQVASGDIRILDIVMDSGGGARESGTGTNRVILKNTSIGQPTAGAYIVGSQTVVGSGHAYKADYCYKQGCPDLVGLERLVVRADSDSGATDRTDYDYTRKLSGLRAAEDGQQYYNNLLVQPYIFGEDADIELAGAAFTDKGFKPQGTFTYRFDDLLKTVVDSKGFLVIYANKDTTHFQGPPPSLSTCRTNFCARSYYVYGPDGQWKRIVRGDDPTPISLNGVDIMQISVHRTESNPPKKPAFSVQLLKPLADDAGGLREWETYGFVTSTSELYAQISQAEPTANAPVAVGNFYSSGIKANFYLFALE